MYECHAHIMLDGVSRQGAERRHNKGVEENWIRAELGKYAAEGVFFVRDGGDRFGVSLRAACIAKEYGIDFRTPCFAIHRKRRYGAMLGCSYENMAEYKELIKEVKAQNGDFIKIMATGILDFNEYGKITSEPIEANELAEMVRIAHGEGFAVMAHCNGADPVKAAVAAGVDSIEHGFYLDAQALRDIVATKTVWVPTFAPIYRLIGKGYFPDDILWHIVRKHAEEVEWVVAAGGTVAAGSDAGALHVPHAVGIKHEYNLMEAAASCEILEKGGTIIEKIFKRN